MKKITNPIFNELLKLKIINKKNIIKLNNSTKDKKISIFQDTKSEVIFLEKYTPTLQYYKKINDKVRILKRSDKKIITITHSKKKFKLHTLEDDQRRAAQFISILKDKNILDFGCAWGGFLNKVIKPKSLTGIELRKECVSYIKKNIKKIHILDNLNISNKKYDVITMFHVLEHIPYQIETLKELKKKLQKNGKIVIEVPSANDFLIKIDQFKKFTFWSGHLILHTENSLITILKAAGFAKIKIKHYQRYNFSNHLGWFIKKIPGGHNFYKNLTDIKINRAYSDYLIRKKCTDTLIAIASN
jgi:2-polyprenyl-3-methyl-5-hydroxy-6-metoxy-1,4-benzoquinol methylase